MFRFQSENKTLNSLSLNYEVIIHSYRFSTVSRYSKINCLLFPSVALIGERLSIWRRNIIQRPPYVDSLSGLIIGLIYVNICMTELKNI
jgi:hypothetical protein